MSKVSKSENVPKSMQALFDSVVELTDLFSEKNLNEEYAQEIRYATAALCRKRPSPLLKGRVNTWACGITYAIGFVNFLFDKADEPYISAIDLCKEYGVSKSTGGAKSKIVKDTLNMMQLDPHWCVESRLDDNPMVWTIQVDGFMVDARSLPRNIQEIAYEKGIIPYIPADK